MTRKWGHVSNDAVIASEAAPKDEVGKNHAANWAERKHEQARAMQDLSLINISLRRRRG